MGKMDLIPVLGKEFVIYFPMFIAILCLATLFNAYGRLLRILYVKNYLYEEGETSGANITDGRALIDLERTRRERNTRLDVRIPELSPLDLNNPTLEHSVENITARTRL
jgi:hypothetical protein